MKIRFLFSNMITSLFVFSLFFVSCGDDNPSTSGYTVTTLAGKGISSGPWTYTGGYADGLGTEAIFDFPNGVAVDSLGNVYVADSNNHRIRKISPTGVVTTLAGSGVQGYTDGPVTEAQFRYPYKVAVDVSGNVYVAEGGMGEGRIRKISPAGVVTTIAEGGPYSAVAVDASGNVYGAVTLFNNGISAGAQIRKISPIGEVTTIAEGTYRAVAVDVSGNVYGAFDTQIRKISPTGVVSTFAGSDVAGYIDGPGTEAQFRSINGIAVDSLGNVYVADSNNHRIRKISPAREVTTIAGSGPSALPGGGGSTHGGHADGPGTEARFGSPNDVAVDSLGNVYVADTRNHRIRKIHPGR